MDLKNDNREGVGSGRAPLRCGLLVQYTAAFLPVELLESKHTLDKGDSVHRSPTEFFRHADRTARAPQPWVCSWLQSLRTVPMPQGSPTHV